MKKIIYTVVVGIILTSYFTFPLLLNLTNHYNLVADFFINSWIYWYTQNSFFNGSIFNITDFFNTTHLYPFPSTLAHQDFLLIPSLLLYSPIYQITHNHILGINFAIFMSFVLNFTSAFICLKKMVKDNIGSLLGAIVFAFSPNVINLNTGHLEYLNRYLIPPFFLFLYNFFDEPNLKNILGLSIIYTLSWFTNIQITIFITILGLFSFLFFSILQVIKGKRNVHKIIKILKHTPLILLFFPIIYIYFSPYITYSVKENFTRTIDEAAFYSAKPIDFLVPFPNNKVFGKIASKTEKLRMIENEDQFNYNERTLLPGYFVIIILPILIIFKLRYFKKNPDNNNKNRNFWFLYFSVLVFAVFLAFGPYLNIGDTQIKLPYYYISKYFPPLGAIRTPTRIQYVWMFPVAYIVAVGTVDILKPLKLKLKFILFGLILSFVTLEYSNTINITNFDIKPINFNLNNKRVVFMPFRYGAPILNDALYTVYSMNNNLITINGHTGFEHKVTGYDQLIETLTKYSFTDRWFNILHALNIDYVILDKTGISQDENQGGEFAKQINNYKYLSVFEDSKWLIFDISIGKNSYRQPCNDSSPKDLNLKYNPIYVQNEKALYLEYKGENNYDCSMSFLYDKRYVDIKINIVDSMGKTRNVRTNLLLPPYLLPSDKFSQSILLKTGLYNQPSKIYFQLFDNTYTLEPVLKL